MSQRKTVTEILTDSESDFRRAVHEHARYIEEAYALPETRSLVLSLAQFGVTTENIQAVLDVSERMVRQHWSLIHTSSIEPQHYSDVFGLSTPAFSEIGSSDGIWPWPWTHGVTVEYEDPDVGTNERKTLYKDAWFGNHGADYLVVQETTHTQPGYDKTNRIRYMYSHGEHMARHLTSNAETPWEYEAISHLIELAKGDSNGARHPDEVLGISYEELPTFEGSVSGPHADMAEHFTESNVTIQNHPVDWDYVKGNKQDRFVPFGVHRTDDGLEVR